MDSVEDRKTPPEQRNSTVVFMTIADTTWRIFVPGVGCTFLGVWLDAKLDTAPFMMFTGVVFGFIFAGFAVALQYKRLKNL